MPIQIYNKIILSQQKQSYYKAKLNLARVYYKKISNSDKKEYVKVLEMLEDIQRNKYLPNEPIHLEAALDYVDIKMDIEPLETRTSHMLLLLKHIKEDFSNQQDILSKDYHTMRELMPDKNLIYQSYMMLLDAKDIST